MSEPSTMWHLFPKHVFPPGHLMNAFISNVGAAKVLRLTLTIFGEELVPA